MHITLLPEPSTLLHLFHKIRKIRSVASCEILHIVEKQCKKLRVKSRKRRRTKDARASEAKSIGTKENV